jgi:hypothetical protein
MNASPSSRIVDRDGVEGTIVRAPAPQSQDDSTVLVQFRRGHQVLVPTVALVEQRCAGGASTYYLPLSLVELERHQHGLMR